MKFLLKSASYVFHPLWMPFAGSLIYFLLSPRYFPTGVIKAKLLAIAILTLFIPVVFYFLLKNLGKAKNMFLYDVKERKWPSILLHPATADGPEPDPECLQLPCSLLLFCRDPGVNFRMLYTQSL